MPQGMRYFQVDGYNVLHGSLRRDTPVQRCVWLALMALCSLSRDWGIIASNVGEAYDDDYMAFMCGVGVEEFQEAIKHHVEQGRITRLDWGGLKLNNWDDYQNSRYARVAKHRLKKGAKSVSVETKPVSVETKKVSLKEKKLKELTNSCAKSFDQFWEHYPKKKSKGDAEKAWKVIKPDETLTAKIIMSVELARRSDDWKKDLGKYIPYPATWLRAKGWEDEIGTGELSDCAKLVREENEKANGKKAE